MPPSSGNHRTQIGKYKVKGRRGRTLRRKQCKGHIEKTPFPFTKLPPEIRNQIYGYLLTSEIPIGITALQPLEYERATSTRTVERTTFMNPSDEDTPYEKEYETTYALEPICNQILPYVDLLRVNRQIRLEGSVFLYGTNTFVFGNSRCLLPFMCERSLETVGLVRSLVIAMVFPAYLPTRLQNPYHSGYSYWEWEDILSGLGECKELQLEEIHFYIFGRVSDMHTRWIWRGNGWGICNLEKLGLEICPIPSLDGYKTDESDDAESPTMVLTRLDELMWNNLASKLLKKEGAARSDLKDRRLPPLRYDAGHNFMH